VGRACQYVVPPSTVAIAKRGTPAAIAEGRNRSMPSSVIAVVWSPPSPCRQTITGSRSVSAPG
jgi:hypothetical protein